MTTDNPFAAPEVDLAHKINEEQFLIRGSQGGLLLEDMVALPRFCICCNRPAQFRKLHKKKSFWGDLFFLPPKFQMQFWLCWRHYLLSVLLEVVCVCLTAVAILMFFGGLLASKAEILFYAAIMAVLTYVINKHVLAAGRIHVGELRDDATYLVTGFNKRFLSRFRER